MKFLKKYTWRGGAVAAALLLAMTLLSLSVGAKPALAAAQIVLTVTVGDPNNIRADGTTSVTITATTTDSGACTAAYRGLIVQWTTSRGTLSSSSSTTTSTSSQTNASCQATIPFRGNGTTGTANITAVITQPGAAVTQLNLTVVSGTITPTQVVYRDATNSGHVAASTETVYVSTNKVTQVRFRTTNSTDQGANGQVLQATVDKGNIEPWNDADNDNIVDTGEVVTNCADNVTTTFTTKTNIIDGTTYEGTAVFFVCAKAGQAAGPIKVTVKNLTTTMADATTTVTSAGVPNKIEATVSGNTVTAVVKDKDGNNVAENTPVTFLVPSFTGTVAPQCALTSGGKVSASAAFSGGGGQVLVTVFHNSSGAAAACPTGGNTVSASTAVNLGSGVVSGPSSFVGGVPASGSFGLIVNVIPASAPSLAAALNAAGCRAVSLGIVESGVWRMYIVGGPTQINSTFPSTVGATVALFVRCG